MYRVVLICFVSDIDFETDSNCSLQVVFNFDSVLWLWLQTPNPAFFLWPQKFDSDSVGQIVILLSIFIHNSAQTQHMFRFCVWFLFIFK